MNLNFENMVSSIPLDYRFTSIAIEDFELTQAVDKVVPALNQ